MEKGIIWNQQGLKALNSYMWELFDMQEVDIGVYSPLAFAYIGDCVYDLVIKSLILNQGNRPVQKLHEETSHLVQASAQSRMMRKIQEHLTTEEHEIYRRGRNSKSVTPAKNQSVTDYRRATGFEALVGYLYLKGEYSRMLELIKIGLDGLGVNDGKESGEEI